MSDEPPPRGPKDPEGAEDHDVVLLHGRTEDGEGLRALRSRPDRLELAEIRPAREGRPLGRGELVSLHPRQGSPLLWNVRVEYSPERDGEPGRSHEGPARYSSARYCRNYDAVFGKSGRKRRGEPRVAEPAGDGEPRGGGEPDPSALN